MPGRSITLYWLPHCTTCRKAAQYLQKKGRTIAELRDIKSEPLDRTEVVRLAKLLGSADQLFSRRARKYRELNLAERDLSNQEMIQLMSEEYTFIKRPVLVISERAVAGFTPKSYDSFLGE